MRDSWDALRSVMDGTASPETRSRLAAELNDPTNPLSILLSESQAAGEALYGPMMPIIRVSKGGYIARHVLFLSFSATALATILWLWPMPAQAIVLTILFAAGGAGLLFREIWRGWGEIPYAGIRSRGTIFEGIKACVFGFWVVGLVLPLAAFETDPQKIRNLWLLSYLMWVVPFSVAGVLRGMGRRESLAASTLSIGQLFNVGALHWILMFPWVWVGSWCLMYAIPSRVIPAFASPGGVQIIYGSIVMAAMTCLVFAAQTALKPSPNILGNWLTAFMGSFYIIVVAGYSVLPIVVLTVWLLGGSILFWLAIALAIAGYFGFVMGAAAGIEMTDHRILREHLRVGIGLLVAACAAFLIVQVVFATSPQIGITVEFSRLLALILGVATFFTVWGKMDNIARRALTLPPIEVALEPPVQPKASPRSFTIRDAFVGPSLMLLDLQSSFGSLRRDYASSVGSV